MSADVTFDGDRLPMGVTRHIVATFRVPHDQHLYGEPVPDGLVAATIELDDIDGVLSHGLLAPPTSSMTLSGSGDTLQVYYGDVVLRLPVAQNARAMQKDDGGRHVVISGRLRWQAGKMIDRRRRNSSDVSSDPVRPAMRRTTLPERAATTGGGMAIAATLLVAPIEQADRTPSAEPRTWICT